MFLWLTLDKSRNSVLNNNLIYSLKMTASITWSRHINKRAFAKQDRDEVINEVEICFLTLHRVWNRNYTSDKKSFIISLKATGENLVITSIYAGEVLRHTEKRF